MVHAGALYLYLSEVAMQKNYRVAAALAAIALVLAASGCAKKSQALKVGATPVPHAELLNLVKDDLAKKGVQLEVVEFTDYVTPNLALADKQIDANFFQHVPYLESFAADRKLELEAVAKIHVEPLGLYSKKFAKVEELPAKATIAIPNDPTNEGRALILLQAKGLIKLAPDSGLKAGPAQIVENPKGFAFKELEAAELPRTLQDVDAAVINGNYALQSGLNPIKDALLLEGSDSPYVNVLVVRKGEGKDPRIQALIAALQSQKVKDYILQHYNGGVVAAF
jgi:ABC-type metal ion transport system, periplasmic component/surface antigen